jgi:hypothetical protein
MLARCSARERRLLRRVLYLGGISVGVKIELAQKNSAQKLR